MVDGVVSIAVRSVYPGKQARILSSEVLQEAKKRPAMSCAKHKVSSAMSINRIIVTGTIRIVGGLASKGVPDVARRVLHLRKELQAMFSASAIVCEMKEDPGQIKSEWLGAEARVHLAPRTLLGNRFVLWSRGLSVPILIISCLSGLAMGGYLAFFARGQFGSRHRRIGFGKRGEPFRVSRELTPCLE